MTIRSKTNQKSNLKPSISIIYFISYESVLISSYDKLLLLRLSLYVQLFCACYNAVRLKLLKRNITSLAKYDLRKRKVWYKTYNLEKRRILINISIRGAFEWNKFNNVTKHVIEIPWKVAYFLLCNVIRCIGNYSTTSLYWVKTGRLSK